MKKKIISLLLAAVASAGALGLASCGDDNGNSPVDDGVLKSDKVASEAEWKAAFDWSDVTNATLLFVINETQDGKVGTFEKHCFVDGQKSYTKVERTRDGESTCEENCREYKPDELVEHESYGTVGTLYYYHYDSEAKKWTYSKSPSKQGYVSSDFEKTIRSDFDDDYTAEHISDSYADFKWDENNYQYVATWDEFKRGKKTAKNVKITIIIQNKKIVAGTLELDYEDEYKDYETEEVIKETGSIKGDFKIYDIGSTKVTLPQAEEEKD